MSNTASWAKAGLMIRESLNANSRQVILFISPTEGIALQGRSSTGGDTASFENKSGIKAPGWLRIKRVGNLFTSSYSADGKTWEILGSTTVTMKTDVKIGLAVSSHRDGVTCNAIFSNVEMKNFGI